MLNALTSLLLAAGALAKIKYAGVAESGGEFGVYSATATPGTGLPGRFGVDYAFINQSSIDVWVDQNKVSIKGNRRVNAIITHVLMGALARSIHFGSHFC